MSLTASQRSSTLVVACALATAVSARAQVTNVTVNSIAQLRDYADDSNVHVTLAPGEYRLGKNGADRTFLQFTGSGSTFDLGGATLWVDSQDLKGFGGGHENVVNLVGLYGSGVTVNGLKLDTRVVNNKEGWADMYANSVKISGTGNTLNDAKITTRGSTAYGYGDAFGKGGAPTNANQPGGLPFLNHHKHSGIMIREAVDAKVDGLQLDMHTFGHGVYLQKVTGATLRGVHIVGELANSNAVIAHSLYQHYGYATYGQPIAPNIQLSKSEDGIRTYGVEDGWLTTGVHIDGAIVKNMRDGITLADSGGTSSIRNSEVYGSEIAYTPTSGTVIENSKGDATNGPLLFFRRAGLTGVVANVELVGNGPQVGQDYPLAIISGSGNSVSLTGANDALNDDNAVVRVGQRWNEWRHAPSPIDNGNAASSLSLMNSTGQTMVIGPNAMNATRDFNVTNGNVLGGAGTIETSITTADVSITFQSGSKLDPRGELTFDMGDGLLDLRGAVSGANVKSLLFDLNAPAGSDTVRSLSTLNIGNGVLNLSDFDFTTGSTFGAGTYVLFESDQSIVGTLGSGVTGALASYATKLSISSDGRSILLVVVPEPTSLVVLLSTLFGMLVRRPTSERAALPRWRIQ